MSAALLNTTALKTEKPVLICDTECYHGYWLVAFKRISDGRVVSFELSARSPLDANALARIRAIMERNTIVTFNGQSYDIPMIFYALSGATNAQLKQASDRIIKGGVKYWEVEQLLGIRIPKIDHIDLIEPQPNAFASLKSLNGRLHGRTLQDLPIEPDAILTFEDMDRLTAYCGNDLDATHLLFDALAEPLKLRQALGAEYGMNFMSKSDAQIGEAILKKGVEKVTGERVQRVQTPPGTSFRYTVPPYLRFETLELVELLDRVREVDFIVKADGKVDLPAFLNKKTVTLGRSTYALGIGGLHSTEANRAVLSDEDHQLVDYDVASYYPAIILGSGLYPKSLGPAFLDVYRKIRDDRVVAKRAGIKVTAEGLKIALNGCYGKLGSTYSVLYAPHLMIAVTVTGQLALLMLIERAERAGIPVVSGNTDGIVFRCPRDRMDDLAAITKQWEADTGFELEASPYRALYSMSVNSYYALKNDGGHKRIGLCASPITDGDHRKALMKNPERAIVSDAVLALIRDGTPVEDTIYGCKDIRAFVTVVKVTNGATWRGEYLGKTVRFVWAIAGDPILDRKPHATTGNFKKVSNTDGCRPLMTLPDEFPVGLLDYERYVAAANDMLAEIGFYDMPPEPLKPKARAAALKVLLQFEAVA